MGRIDRQASKRCQDLEYEFYGQKGRFHGRGTDVDGVISVVWYYGSRAIYRDEIICYLRFLATDVNIKVCIGCPSNTVSFSFDFLTSYGNKSSLSLTVQMIQAHD